MDIWSCLKEVAILIVVYEITIAESDLLESFRPREDNPPELNEFLNNVLDHRSDFTYIKEAARRYQKMKKDTLDVDPLNQPMEFYTGYQDNYKADLKRHAHSYPNLKKYRSFADMPPKRQQKKSHRYRRHAKKRNPAQFLIEKGGDNLKRRIPQQMLTLHNQKQSFKKPIPSEIFIQPQGEKLEKRASMDVVVEPEGKKGEQKVRGAKSTKTKKQAMYMETPVHHANNYYKQRDRYNERRGNEQGDVYYVDLEDAARREQDRYGDRKRYGFNPRRPIYYRPYDKRPNRPCAKTKQEKLDYPIYESEPHHGLNDEVGFERALSYEVEPRVPEGSNYNNPSGNNLYSVDEGRPDNIQPFYSSRWDPSDRFQGYDYPQVMSNERFFINSNNNLKDTGSTGASITSAGTGSESSSTNTTTSGSETPTTEANEKKTVKQIGNGFIEISKTRRDDEESSLQQPLVGQDDDYGSNRVSSVPFRRQPETMGMMDIENQNNREEERPFGPLDNIPRAFQDEESVGDMGRPYDLPKNSIQQLQSVEAVGGDYEGPSFISRELRKADVRNDKLSSIQAKASLQTLEEKDAENDFALEPSIITRDAKNDEEMEDSDRDERHIQAKNEEANQEPRHQRDVSSEKAPIIKRDNEDDADVVDRDERNAIGEKPSPVSKEISSEIDKVVKDTVDRFSRDPTLPNDHLDIKEGEDLKKVTKHAVSTKQIANEADKEIKEVDDYDHDESAIMSKHSLHPLRVRDVEEEQFRSRKLQFIDEEMMKIDSSQEYLDLPNRPRRDFLDALGMKNEEDYSEDNPYKEELRINNTDVNNDTFRENTSSTGTEKCIVTTTTTKSTLCPQKEDIKNIKQILEEPKEVTAQNTVGNFKKDKEKKVAKKRYSESKDSNGLGRRARETSDTREASDIAQKILQNSNKIYNRREDLHNRKYGNQERGQDVIVPKWERSHDMMVKKSAEENSETTSIQDNEFLLDFETTTTSSTIPLTTNYTTESENVNSTYEQVAHQMDIENEKLAQVVNGHLATKIVSTVFDQLKKKSSLKTKFYSGLSRKHVDFAGTIDFDIFKTNETEDVDEAKLLLEQITKVLNKLVLNQVRRKLCQRLPDELKEYLNTILNVKNTVETANFVPNTNQGNFLFTYQQQVTPPFDVQKLQATLMQLEGLLSSYNNLNDDCQNRAEPVKEYIEKHIKMLKPMVSCPDHHCENLEMKRNSPPFHRLLIEKDLEDLGLGNKHNFVPEFDLNQLVKNKMKIGALRKEHKRDIQRNGGYKTEKYKRLQLAAEKVREKRENEAKIVELFGGKKKRSPKRFEVDFEEPMVYRLG